MKSNRMDFNLAGILTDPRRQWSRIRREAQGCVRTAFRKLDVDWTKYNTRDYLFTHDTACCSVETESNGYWITPPCWELVNANGNAWTTPVLLASFKTFIGGENYREHCFARGTRVLMADGAYVPIEEIKAGDRVINRLGQEDTVTDTMSRKSDDIYEIGSEAILSGKLTVTGSHPFYAVEDGREAKWVTVEALDPERHMIASPAPEDAPGAFRTPEGGWLPHGFSKSRAVAGEIDVYNLEVENDNSYVAEGVVVHNCQVPALSKGKILDAIIRPVKHHSEKYGDASIYVVDVLVATNRKHRELVDRIESGELNTLSMGTLAEVTQCSICGRQIHDGEENCEHLDRHIGQMVTCDDGKDRICAELCGGVDENGNYIDNSNSFIEISWVEHPAFSGAVVNAFVETDEERTLREGSRDELSRLFEGNLFERLRVADRESSIALSVVRKGMRDLGIADRISKRLGK